MHRIISVFFITGCCLFANDYLILIQPCGWHSDEINTLFETYRELDEILKNHFSYNMSEFAIRKEISRYDKESGIFYLLDNLVMKFPAESNTDFGCMIRESADSYHIIYDANTLLFILSSSDDIDYEIYRGDSIYFYPETGETIIAPADLKVIETGNHMPALFLNLSLESVMGHTELDDPDKLFYCRGDILGQFDSIGSLLINFHHPSELVNLLPIFIYHVN